MLKKIMSVLLIGLMFIPILSFADTKEYVTETLEEALTTENIEHDLKDYKESDDKINIYLFRSNGCMFCDGFLTFLYNNIEEYGKYFNLVSYEVSSNANNSELFKEVEDFTGRTGAGVPYIIIGDKIFDGFTEDFYGDDVKDAIIELYQSNDRYDIFEAMEEKESSNDIAPTIIMWNAIFTVVAVSVVLFINNRQIKILNAKIDTLEKSLHKKK